MPQVAWIAHTATKAAADLVLDTNLKNGHTSTTDALWAGVPVVSMLGLRMGSRVAAFSWLRSGTLALAKHTLRPQEIRSEIDDLEIVKLKQ